MILIWLHQNHFGLNKGNKMIFDDVKKQQLQARKDKDLIRTALLTTLLGELKTLAIDKKLDSLPDEDCIGVIKAFLKSVNETLSLAMSKSCWGTVNSLLVEKDVLIALLPSQLSEEELTSIIKGIMADNGYSSKKDLGKVMQALKAGYNGQYDGGTASKLIGQLLV